MAFPKKKQYKLPVKYDELHWSERRIVREQYIKEQKGLCWHCKNDLMKDPPEFVLKKNINGTLFPKGFFDNPIHLQHDHVTGWTEGAVHAYCNAVLWEYHGK